MKKYILLVIIAIFLVLGGTGYLAIDHYGMKSLISLIGVVGVAGIIFAETGLLVGFFLPGDSLLFTAGFLISQDIFLFNIHWLAFIVFAAAAAGDSLGYAFGKRVGPRLFSRQESLLFHKENLRRAEEFYEKHGGKTIILARFVPVIRTFAPIVAGISWMSYRRFVAFNVVGAFLWTYSLTYLGYFAGDWITSAGINLQLVILGIIFLSILPPIIHVLREPKTQSSIKSGIKQIKQGLFK